jgi:hypothetical protein
VRGGFFSKARLYSIGGELHPWNYVFGNGWNVHTDMRVPTMLENEWMQAEERRFLDDPRGAIGARSYEALERLSEVVGLDYFGIDFTVLDDGELMVFEANASVGFFQTWAKTFRYLYPVIDRLGAAFNALMAAKLAHRER